MIELLPWVGPSYEALGPDNLINEADRLLSMADDGLVERYTDLYAADIRPEQNQFALKVDAFHAKCGHNLDNDTSIASIIERTGPNAVVNSRYLATSGLAIVFMTYRRGEAIGDALRIYDDTSAPTTATAAYTRVNLHLRTERMKMSYIETRHDPAALPALYQRLKIAQREAARSPIPVGWWPKSSRQDTGNATLRAIASVPDVRDR